MTDMTESTELLAFKRQKDGYKVTVKISSSIFVVLSWEEKGTQIPVSKQIWTPRRIGTPGPNPPANLDPPGPNPLADMDPPFPRRFGPPYQTFFKHCLYHIW